MYEQISSIFCKLFVRIAVLIVFCNFFRKKEKNIDYFLKKDLTNAFEFGIISESQDIAGMAQSVEHVIGNDEVISSILITSSKKSTAYAVLFVFI